MSSSAMVNVLSNINKPFEYKGIKVNVIYRTDGKSLTRARDVCDILGLNKKDSMNALDRHVPRRHKIPFRELKNLEIRYSNLSTFHDDTIFLTNSGVYRLILTSKCEEADMFMDWVTEEVLEGVFEKGYYDLREQHQVAIDIKDLAIETKNSALALLNDDLDESQSNVAVLEHDNLELQRQNEILRRRYVPYLEDRSKNNSMIFIRKNNGAIFENVAICGQQQYVTKKMQHKLADFPNGEIILLVETPNAIAHYNYFRQKGYINIDPDRSRHFNIRGGMLPHQLLGLEDV